MVSYTGSAGTITSTSIGRNNTYTFNVAFDNVGIITGTIARTADAGAGTVTGAYRGGWRGRRVSQRYGHDDGILRWRVCGGSTCTCTPNQGANRDPLTEPRQPNGFREFY